MKHLDRRALYSIVTIAALALGWAFGVDLPRDEIAGMIGELITGAVAIVGVIVAAWQSSSAAPPAPPPVEAAPAEPPRYPPEAS